MQGTGADGELVEKILGAKTLYDVLGVDKTCSETDIKRGYRKTAVGVHPDRCKHPKATEAFQKLSHAYQTLSDPDKRAHYDRFGDRPEPQPGMYTGGQFYGNQYRYEGEISPEEIFAAFFGGMNPGGMRFNFQNMNGQFNFHNMGQFRQRPTQHNFLPNWRVLISFIPIALMLIMTLFSNSSSESKLVNIIKFDDDIDERQFQIMITPKMQKRFGVPRSWLKQQRDRGNMRDPGRFYELLKKEADNVWISHLQQKCKSERGTRSRSKPSCDELRKANVRA